MNLRPELNKSLNVETFRSYYYLKEELIAFCKVSGLSTSGSKEEITDRIAHYLMTGEALKPQARAKSIGRSKTKAVEVTEENTIIEENMLFEENTIIEEDMVCSEKHREFFKQKIGKSFSFHVAFQKWLKSNAGKTYQEAIEAYYQILEDKKRNKSAIDKQFEYNTYIREFFADNEGKTLKDAIQCWKYKKSRQGHNRYEKSDLTIL